MRKQFPLTNKDGKTTGRLTLFDTESAAGTVVAGSLSIPMRAVVKRADDLTIIPALNVADDVVDLPAHAVGAVVDELDDLAGLFDDDDVQQKDGALQRTAVAIHIERPDVLTITAGATEAAHELSWAKTKTMADGRPRYGLVGDAFTLYAANGTAWSVYVGASFVPDWDRRPVEGHTDDTTGEWVPADPGTVKTTGTLRLRPRYVNR